MADKSAWHWHSVLTFFCNPFAVHGLPMPENCKHTHGRDFLGRIQPCSILTYYRRKKLPYAPPSQQSSGG